MLQVFPFLAWLAVGTSGVLLVVFWTFGELGERARYLLVGWFLAAAACQFLPTSDRVSAAGLFLQTVLAVYLLVRWKAGA